PVTKPAPFRCGAIRPPSDTPGGDSPSSAVTPVSCHATPIRCRPGSRNLSCTGAQTQQTSVPMDDELIHQFIADGFVKIEQAVPTDVAAACASLLWAEIDAEPDAPSTWTEPVY